MARRPFSTSPIKPPPPGPHYPENAPPTNTVPSGQTGYISASKYFSEIAGNQLLARDVDTPLVTATLTTTNGTLTVVPNPGVIVSNNSTARVIVIGSVENINRAMNGMHLDPVTDFSGTAVITLRTSDGLTPISNSFNVAISGVAPPPPPQPPQNYVAPGTRETPYQTAYTFPLNSISVYDADTPNVTATLTATNGTCTVTAGGAVVTGSGTATVSISGTQAQINAALNTAVFTPATNFSGIAKITLSTSDGALTDSDTFDITVNSPVLGPINRVPGPQTTPRNTSLQLRSYPNNTEFFISAAYKPSLETRIKCLHGTLNFEPSPAQGALLADGFPEKFVYGYWPHWGTQPILSVGAATYAIGLMSLHNSGNGTDEGSMSWPTPGWPTAVDVQRIRADGQKVLLVIGGNSYRFYYTTRQQSTNLLNSIREYVNAIGGIDGVDFQCFDSAPDTTDLRGETVYIAQQLRAEYGANFAIVLSFLGWNAPMKALAIALYGADCLTWLQCLYLGWPNYKGAGNVNATNNTLMNESGLTGTRMVLGFSANYDYTNNLTLSECSREWNYVVQQHPSTRGVGCYTTETDAAAPSYGAFATTFKNQKFGTAGYAPNLPGYSGQNTKELVFVGNRTQINFLITWMNYTPDPAYFGQDTITMTTSDGTLSDVDEMPITVT
jgi:hypothetical protein